jgi:hypothetical protein
MEGVNKLIHDLHSNLFVLLEIILLHIFFEDSFLLPDSVKT